MSGAELKISVGDLDAAGKQFVFPLRAAWIRGVLEDHEATSSGQDGLLDVRASRSGNDIVVHGTLKASLVVPCARCLDPVPLEIDEQLSLLFVPGKVTPPPAAKKSESGDGHGVSPAKKGKPKSKKADVEEYELGAEDADTLPYDGEVVILDDVVRDEMILETPIFPLCREDCPGISPPPAKPSEAVDGSSAEPQGEAKAGRDADIDPRLLPLLGLRGKRD
jgi:uncharacterized protein